MHFTGTCCDAVVTVTITKKKTLYQHSVTLQAVVIRFAWCFLFRDQLLFFVKTTINVLSHDKLLLFVMYEAFSYVANCCYSFCVTHHFAKLKKISQSSPNCYDEKLPVPKKHYWFMETSYHSLCVNFSKQKLKVSFLKDFISNPRMNGTLWQISDGKVWKRFLNKMEAESV